MTWPLRSGARGAIHTKTRTVSAEAISRGTRRSSPPRLSSMPSLPAPCYAARSLLHSFAGRAATRRAALRRIHPEPSAASTRGGTGERRRGLCAPCVTACCRWRAGTRSGSHRVPVLRVDAHRSTQVAYVYLAIGVDETRLHN
eukprot:scaffold1042_cov401-Prasinococcus_capsulatus_cf.AAC.15